MLLRSTKFGIFDQCFCNWVSGLGSTVNLKLMFVAGKPEVTVLCKLDANCGFWQIPLESSSCLLTTFVTPFGCFCFNKLSRAPVETADKHYRMK